MKYSVCIDAVFRALDSVDALDKVRAAGFTAFEFWNRRDRDMDALKEKKDALGLRCVAFVAGKANLTFPEEHVKWLGELEKSARIAKNTGTGRLIVTAGNDTGADRAYQRRAIVTALKASVPVLAENDLTLLLEPLNGRVDHRGTYLESSGEAFDILDEVGSERVKLLFDIYHQQITEGNIIDRMTARIKDIGHIHCAGIPGRHELDRGELDYRNIFAVLDEAGYEHFAGLEYFPEDDGLSGLKRLRDYLPG